MQSEQQSKEEYEKNTSSVRKNNGECRRKNPLVKHNNTKENTKSYRAPKYTAEEDTSMYGTIEQPLVKEVNKRKQ